MSANSDPKFVNQVQQYNARLQMFTFDSVFGYFLRVVHMYVRFRVYELCFLFICKHALMSCVFCLFSAISGRLYDHTAQTISDYRSARNEAFPPFPPLISWYPFSHRLSSFASYRRMMTPPCVGLAGPFDSAIILLRNPFDALWAEYQRFQSRTSVCQICKCVIFATLITLFSDIPFIYVSWFQLSVSTIRSSIRVCLSIYFHV